jgi:hypothetical protein
MAAPATSIRKWDYIILIPSLIRHSSISFLFLKALSFMSDAQMS